MSSTPTHPFPGRLLSAIFMGLVLANLIRADGKEPGTPLDLLKAADIPATERFARQPKELVAVFGSHRWHHWTGTTSQVVTDGKNVTVLMWNQARGNKLYVHDAATSKDLGTFQLPGGVPANGAGFSPSGKLVALCQENPFDWSGLVWDVA